MDVVPNNVKQFVRRALGRPQIPSGLRLPPTLSGGLPVLGHTVEFLGGAVETLFRAQRELGEVAAFNVFHRKMVALFGPDAHEAVFRAPDDVLNPSQAYEIMTPIFGKGLVYNAPADVLSEQLKMLLPALKDRRMRTYGEQVVREVEESVDKWGEAGVVDLVDYCRALTNFTSSRCLLGKEFREGMNEEFAQVYHDLERGLTPWAYVNPYLPLPSFRKRDKARVRMVEMITKIVEARRREKRTGEDFLQTLMDAQYSTGRSLSEHEITGLLLAGMFAGHHTSSVTTAWVLIELLQNPQYMRRAVAEVDRVFGGGKPVTHQALRELDFLENCIKETLRLHPPLFMLVRVALQDFVFKGYFFEKGTWLVVSPTVAHRMASVFANPEAFEPERFAPPREEDKRDFAYIAFGGGRHKCLGNAFAILQVKAIMAMLLGQFDFESGGDPVTSDFHGLVVGPKEPCRVRYKRRANPSVSIKHAAELAAVANARAEDAAAAAGCPVPHAEATNGSAAAKCPVDHSKPAAAAPAPTAEAKPAKVRFRLDHDLCQGHAVCVGEAPEVFHLGKNGKVAAKLFEASGELGDKILKAAQYCPTRAIRIRED